jgi:hypothetical protein
MGSVFESGMKTVGGIKGADAPEPSAAASGDPYLAGAQAAGEVAKFGYDVYQDERNRKEKKEDKRAQEQMSMRGEATYRQNRAVLMDMIGQFYAKRGWDLPETNFPGQGTSRPIPGDENVYAGYDVDPSYLTHQPLDPEGNPVEFDPNNPSNTVNQAAFKQMTDAEKALQNAGGISAQEAQIASNQFKPVNRPKAMRANMMAQAVGAGTSVPVEDPMEQVVQPVVQQPVVAAPVTAMPTTGALSNTGRRRWA